MPDRNSGAAMLVNDPASGGVTNGATPDLARIERAVAELLAAVGEDPTRDGLRSAHNLHRPVPHLPHFQPPQFSP